jgi:hypothetical protein
MEEREGVIWKRRKRGRVRPTISNFSGASRPPFALGIYDIR